MNDIWLGEFSVNFQRPPQVNDSMLKGDESRRGVFVSLPSPHHPALHSLGREGESGCMQFKFYLWKSTVKKGREGAFFLKESMLDAAL